jgi:hypothetical protein
MSHVFGSYLLLSGGYYQAQFESCGLFMISTILRQSSKSLAFSPSIGYFKNRGELYHKDLQIYYIRIFQIYPYYNIFHSLSELLNFSEVLHLGNAELIGKLIELGSQILKEISLYQHRKNRHRKQTRPVSLSLGF